jgi:HAD superfamily hydrolase (TIGR01549 family)
VDFFSSLGLTKGEIRIWLDEILTNNYNNFEEILNVVKPGVDIYTQKYDYEIQQEIEETVVFDDVYSTLERLKKKYKIYLLSNISTPYTKAYYDLKLNQYIDKPFFSCDIGYRKPQKEAFEFVLKETGLNKNQVIMIGDSLGSDFNGAQNVGIKAILKDKPLSIITQDLI